MKQSALIEVSKVFGVLLWNTILAEAHQLFVGGTNCGVDSTIQTTIVGGRTVAGCTLVEDPEVLYKVMEPGTVFLLDSFGYQQNS